MVVVKNKSIPNKLRMKIEDKLAQSYVTFKDMSKTGSAVKRLLGPAFGVLEDGSITGDEHQLLLSYLIHVHPSYMAKLTNMGQFEVEFYRTCSMSGYLNFIYHQLQRVRFGKPEGSHRPPLSLLFGITSIILHNPANHAASIAEALAESMYCLWRELLLMHEDKQQDQEIRSFLIIQMKDGITRYEQQQKHLMLYLDWCISKFQGGRDCSRSLLALSKLVDLGYDRFPAEFSVHDTHQ
jgi:hypothetical protein